MMKSDNRVADRSVDNCSAFWIISASVRSFIISSAFAGRGHFRASPFLKSQEQDTVAETHNYPYLRRHGREKGTHDRQQAAVYAV